MLATGDGTSPGKETIAPSAASNTPAKAEAPGGKETPEAPPSAGASPGATVQTPDKKNEQEEARPPHKEDQEIIFDWRNNATTTLRQSLMSGEMWERNSHLPPGMPRRFCRIRFTPRAAWDGRKQHGGYIYLCVACITFIDEDSSTPNRIGLYDMMPCSGGEVMCRDSR